MLKIINCSICGKEVVYKTKKSKYCSRKCKYKAIGKTQQKAWRAKNAGKWKDCRAKWRASNRAKVKAQKDRWMANNPDKQWAIQRRQCLKKYGLSPEDYELRYKEQNGLCAICKTHHKMYGRDGLVVDHDHRTGALRSLLCASCNKALGLVRESWPILISMAQYLFHTGTYSREQILQIKDHEFDCLISAPTIQ